MASDGFMVIDDGVTLAKPITVTCTNLKGQLVHGKVIKRYENTCLMVADSGEIVLIHQSKIKEFKWKRKYCTTHNQKMWEGELLGHKACLHPDHYKIL